MGIGQTRRDDMESLGLSFIYMMKGTLPWVDKNIKDKDIVIATKNASIPNTICQGLPQEFLLYFEHIRSLGKWLWYSLAICRSLYGIM